MLADIFVVLIIIWATMIYPFWRNKTKDWSCTCLYASTYRFSKKNMDKDLKCKHIKEFINKFEENKNEQP